MSTQAWSARLLAIVIAALPSTAAAQETYEFDFGDGVQGWGFTSADSGSYSYKGNRYTVDGLPQPCLGIEGDGNPGQAYALVHSFDATPGSTVTIAWDYRAFSRQTPMIGVMVTGEQGEILSNASTSPPTNTFDWYHAQLGNPVSIPGSRFAVFFYLGDQAGDQDQLFQIDNVEITVTPGSGGGGGEPPPPPPPPDPGPGPGPLPVDGSDPLPDSGDTVDDVPTRISRRAPVVAQSPTNCGNAAGLWSALPLAWLWRRATARRRPRATR